MESHPAGATQVLFLFKVAGADDYQLVGVDMFLKRRLDVLSGQFGDACFPFGCELESPIQIQVALDLTGNRTVS